MQFDMGLLCKVSVFVYSCIFLIGKCCSQDITSTEPEQGSQTCNVFLVSGRYGVPDKHLSASSEYNSHHAAQNSRLNTTFVAGSRVGAWGPCCNNDKHHIQVKLNQLSLIQAILTQGRNNTGDKNSGSNQYVKKYKVSYSVDGVEWRFLNNTNGSHELFLGNSDQNSIHVNYLECPLEAQYIRIQPLEFMKHPSMRFDLIGCMLFEENSTTDCGFEEGLCDWAQETRKGLLYWIRENYTRMELLSIPTEFSESCAVNCSLLALAPTNGTNSNVTLQPANLTRFIPKSSTRRCLRVWSTTSTIGGAYLNLTVVGCVQQSTVNRSRIGLVFEHVWTPIEVDLMSWDYQLIINGGWTIGNKGYLAIDHISMTTGYCPDCDFEDDLCNWNNTGNINWKLRTEGLRKFISAKVLHNEADSARLIGPVINISESKAAQTCLRFSYKISDTLTNTLYVYVNRSGVTNLVWTSAVISRIWMTQYVNISSGDDFQIEFEGKVESGSVHVDDVIVLYKHCPVSTAVPVSNVPTDTPGNNMTKPNNVQMYTGIGVSFFVTLVTLMIVIVYVLRHRKGTTNANMEEIQLDDVSKANNVAEVEYAVAIKKSDARNSEKLDMDSDPIYENKCKTEFDKMNDESTPEVDQTYDHFPPDEKLQNLNDETYDHTTFGRKLNDGENHNMPSVLPNSTPLHMEVGDAEDDVTYDNVPISCKLST